MRAVAVLSIALLLAACSGKTADQTLRDAAGSAPAKAAQDSLLAAALKARLAAADLDSAATVHVRVSAGRATLSGSVRSAQVRANLVKAAGGANGVRTVQDDLRIDPRAPSARDSFDDVSVQARVTAALAAQAGVNALRVHVRAHAGAVTLEGSAPSAAIKSTMVAAAKEVAGVRGVVDRLRVAP